MPQIQQVISEVFQGTVQRGKSVGKPFWSITTNAGSRFSTFDEKFIQDVEQGKEYTITYEVTKGKDGMEYLNLSAPLIPCVQVDQDNVNKVHAMVEEKLSSPPKITTQESERTYKNRISALQAAVNYVGETMGGTCSDEALMDYVKLFEKYLSTGQ